MDIPSTVSGRPVTPRGIHLQPYGRNRANRHRTPLDDAVRWRGWEKVQWYAQEAFGFEVQMGKKMEMSK